MNSRSHTWLWVAVAILAAAYLALTATAQSSTPAPLVLTAADRNKLVYVSDFELDPANFKQDKGGITGKGSILPPPPPGLPSLRRKPQDPEAQARKLIDLMSETLVSELKKAGLTVRRMSASDTRPTQGLLVSGVFTEVDEGNQMRRALLGFGSGASKMELYVTVADLSQPNRSLYDLAAQKTSGKKPGAVITLNPYVGAVKFAMTKNAPEKTVKKTAKSMAQELSKQLSPETVAAKE